MCLLCQPLGNLQDSCSFFSVKCTVTSRVCLYTLICGDGCKVFRAMSASSCVFSKAHLHEMHVQYGVICNWGIWFILLNEISESRKCSLVKIYRFYFKENLQNFCDKAGGCPLENITQVLHTSSFPQGGLPAPGLPASVRHLQCLMEFGGNRSSLGGLKHIVWFDRQRAAVLGRENSIFLLKFYPQRLFSVKAMATQHRFQGKLWWCQESPNWELHNAWVNFKATSVPHWSELVSFMHSVSGVCWWIDSIFSLSKAKGHFWRLLTATAGLGRPQQGERSLFPKRTDTLWWLHLIKRGCCSLCYDPNFFFLAIIQSVPRCP